MKIEYEEIERVKLPYKEPIILMVGKVQDFRKDKWYGKGQFIYELHQFKERIVGMRFVDGEYSNDYIQYK